MQQRVISLFHFALNKNGYLLLGASESIGRNTDLFETVAGSGEMFIQDSNSAHIYRRRSIRRSENAAFANTRNFPKSRRMPPITASPSAPAHSTDRQMFEALALSLGKNSVLVTDDYSIVRVYGNVSPF